MGCIISNSKIFINDTTDDPYFMNNTFNTSSLTYNVSKNKEKEYLISFDIDNLTSKNLHYIKHEFLNNCYVLQNYKNILQKIMKVIKYYITQKEIQISYIDYLYFYNKEHGNILHITNTNAIIHRFNDNVKSNKSYFLKCNIDNVY
jgi:hypothetical protein